MASVTPLDENAKETTPNEVANGSLPTLSETPNESSANVVLSTTPAETTTAAANIDKTGSCTDAPPARKKWKWGLPFSFPILKILQGVFLILMIGQSLPGAEKSFWPFNQKSATTVEPAKQAMTPFYVEQRSELYGHERQFPTEPQNKGFRGLFWLLLGDPPPALALPLNTGIPAQQHIVMRHLNQHYEAYRYSIRSVTDSKVQAGHEFARTSFRRALEKVLGRLTDQSDRQRLTRVEEHFLEEAGQLVERHATLRASLVLGRTESATTVDDSCPSQRQNTTEPVVEFFSQQQQIQPTQQCPLNGENSTQYDDDGIPRKKKQRWSANYNETLKQMDATQNELVQTITTFITHIQKSLPPGPGGAVKDALMGHLMAYGTTSFVLDLQQSPLRTLYPQSRPRKRVFVLHFVGDVFAFGVTTLRQEVTAILHSAEATQQHQDEVLVVLQSSGGTVTGYGLIAGQLLRIKEAGLRLTVAVEQVAASGGYLAACVGHTIVCSPFALVGSIGVVREELNVHERLKREGIENFIITAGQYKKVLSPLKEVKTEDLQKVQEELEEVHTLFKKFVSDHRPSLDMDVVATGEVWFGTKAVELGLCDAIRSADDVLTDFVHRGYDVYEVKYHEPTSDLLSKFLDTASLSGKDGTGVIHWFLQKIVLRLKDELLGNSGDVGLVMAR